MLNHFAVVGNPVAHSLSPFMQQAFAAQTGISLVYEKIQVLEDEFKETVCAFFQNGGKGLNITLPYKEQAFALCTALEPRAKEAGAANTLWLKNGLLQGDNTDGIGFIRDLHNYFTPKNQSILILGAGGAVRGLLGPLLREKPARLTIANRTIANAYALQKAFPEIRVKGFDELEDDYDLIINATSTGLKGDFLPIPDRLFTTKPFCYDLAYQKNHDTVFLHHAKQRKCKAVNGLGMLVEQGAESFYLWQGVRPNTRPVLELMQKMR